MADIRYSHNDRVENFGGHKVGRFMLPDPSIGRCWLKTFNGRQILNFNLRRGDRCPEDAYDKTKERAYLVFDADKSSNRPAFTPLRIETTLEMLPSITITSWWFSLAQWNQWPGTDNVWRPPPFSLNISVVNGKEFLVAVVRTLDGFGKVREIEAASMPFERKRYQVAADFLCSNGQDGGRCRLTVNDRIINEYAGPTGYPGREVYAAFGMYRATPRNEADTQTVMYEGFRESAVIG